jgi:hypothetical protein
MAQSLETLKSNIVTTVYGRRLGLQSDETLVGPKSLKFAVQDLSSASTAGTVLNNYGVVVARISGSITTATQPQFLLSNPIPGVGVKICFALTSMGATAGSTAVAFQRATTAFLIQSTDTSTGIGVLLTQGSACELMGLTTDAYMFLRHGTSGAVATVTS